MRFILIPKPDPKVAKSFGSGFNHDVFATYMKFNEELAKAGVLVTSEGINPEVPAARVELSGGKRSKVTDGPFAEAKELIGGFWLIDVKSRAEAIEWAKRAPTGLGGDEIIEIHQMTDLADLPQELRDIIKRVAPVWSGPLLKGA